MTESPPGPAPHATAPSGAGGTPSDAPPLFEFAWRHRLVRPVQGRTFAGVCGALARATNTDPVLWRVILVVLTFFGGIGLAAYLIGWLLLPADGDTATPVEALGGRGWSRTSSGKTIVGLVFAALLLAGLFSNPWHGTPLLAVLVLGGVLLLLLRDQRGRGAAGTPTTAPPAGTEPGGPPPYVPPAAYAPYGPFVASPPRPVPVWAPPPRPPRPRSRLGLVTFSVAVLTLGGLIAADLAGFAVTSLAYIAAPLAVLGLGLVVGTWFGRARWLIPFGIVLSLALGGGYAAVQDGHWTHWRAGTVDYTPMSVSDIQDNYSQDVGDVRLDLSHVDFTGTDVDVTVVVNAGTLEITLPSDVDATVVARVNVGDSEVLGQHWSGIGQNNRTVTDLGRDGTGGGKLHLTATVHTGTLEVHR